MLEKTRAAHGKVLDIKAALRMYLKIRLRVLKVIGLEQEIVPFVRDFSTFANAHRGDLLTSGKEWALSNGDSVEWREVAARISCPKEQKEKVITLLEDEGITGCINRPPQFVESVLRERINADPKLLEKILKVAPGFSLGRGYEQLSINFARTGKRILINQVSGDICLETKD